MTFRGQATQGPDPFDGDPFRTPSSLTQEPTASSAQPSAPGGEINTLATLSVVFAFVFAPAGAVLGHLALAQIKRVRQPGHRRAVLGLTLSYVFIALAVIALIVWFLLGYHGDRQGIVSSPPSVAPPVVASTVITPPPRSRHRVSVAELRVGDCVEIQKNQPDPTRANTDQVYIYRARCEVRDGVFQVERKGTNANQCPPGEYLTNDQENIVACFVKYDGD